MPAKSVAATPQTPAERRRARVREKILSVAERVFGREGVAGLSIRRLAEEINYSPAAIYKYFDSKSALVEELKNAFFERFMTRLDEVMSGDRPFLETARNGLAVYIQTAIERPHHYGAAFTRAGDEETACHPLGETPASLQPDSPASQAFITLRDMIAEGADLGLFRRDLDPGLMALSAWAACHGVAMLYINLDAYPTDMPGTPGINREDFILLHVGMILASVGADPARIAAIAPYPSGAP